MTRKGCIVTVVVLLVLIGGLVLGIYLRRQSVYDPYHHGKRLYTWAEQAIHSPDPAARRQATEALVAGFKDLQRGEPRIQLVMRFAGAEPPLPKEVLPFLVEALHTPELQALGRRSYHAMALSRVEFNAAMPTLVEVILHDEDQRARDGALAALMMVGRDYSALPALREAARDENKEVQRRAMEAVKEIEHPTPSWLP